MATRLATYVVVGIVAVTLIAGLMVGAQRDDVEGPIDLIVFNGKLYTADSSGSVAEAVAVRGNQILRVGSNREINRLRRPQTEVIDARGAAILPGFNDAHVQFLRGAVGLDEIDLLDAASLDEVEMRIRTWAAGNPDRPWVLGRGWTQGLFGGNAPTRRMLDAIVPDRPAQLVSADGRSSWVNSRALALAGVTKRTPNPADGIIAREARSGEPSGVLTDQALALVEALVPQPDGEQKRRALHSAIAEAHRLGITSIHDATDGAVDARLYEEAVRSGDLNLRVYLSMPVRGGGSEADLRELDALSSRYPDDPLLKAGAARITVDGSLESGSAALIEPSPERQASTTTGKAPSISPDDLNRAVRLLDARGLQVMAEASGDRGVRMALDAFTHAARSNPPISRGRRHRIERVGLVDDLDLSRFGLLGVIASMQPFLGSPTAERTEAWIRSAGAAQTFRYGSLSGRGGRVVFGSGWPAAPLNPMAAIHVAVNRTTLAGTPANGWQPAERLPLKRAIDAWTSGPAYASFDEQRKGSLKPGMLADLVVLSSDIFMLPPSRLGATVVAFTVFDGKVVYRRGKSSD